MPSTEFQIFYMKLVFLPITVCSGRRSPLPPPPPPGGLKHCVHANSREHGKKNGNVLVQNCWQNGQQINRWTTSNCSCPCVSIFPKKTALLSKKCWSKAILRREPNWQNIYITGKISDVFWAMHVHFGCGLRLSTSPPKVDVRYKY